MLIVFFIYKEGAVFGMMINNKFKDVINKDAILREFGFVVDNNSRLLKLNEDVKIKKLSK